MSFPEFAGGLLVGVAIVWFGRHVARKPERYMDRNYLWTNTLANELPLRSSTVKFTRWWATFLIWVGFLTILISFIQGFHPSDAVRLIGAAMAIVLTFFATPKEQARSLPDEPWSWRRDEREQRKRLEQMILAEQQRRKRLQQPTKHPRRRLRRENARRRERLP